MKKFVYRNSMKNRNFGKAGARSLNQRSGGEAAQLEQVVRYSRDQNLGCSAQPKTDSSCCFGIICFIILILSLHTSVFANDSITDAEEITYEWLLEQGDRGGYTDHISHFHEIFNAYNVRTLLEFGLGFSTKYFLDCCYKVISVEFITDGYGPDWMNHCLNLYSDYTNWIPIAYLSYRKVDDSRAPYKYFGSEHVYKACSYQTSFHKDYSLIDNFYLIELDAFITNLVKCHRIDCAFVDPGLYLRGDLVQLLFHKVSVIVAHDTERRALGLQGDVYGYSRIATPADYEEIHISHGQGTTIWIKKEKEFSRLSETLKEYALKKSLKPLP